MFPTDSGANTDGEDSEVSYLTERKVVVLDSETINRIAAGEVVERPASVVKELVENSIDAGASSIEIELSRGGTEFIRVVDDGSGMSADDAVLALERHATSKIRTVDDIALSGSLGFRGEALPSIASVARVEIITRTHDADAATKVRVEAGRITEVSQVAARVGTSVTVRDLFHNTPARAKFLKTPATETSRAVDVVTRLALGAPNIRFRVSVEQRQVLSTPGKGQLLDAIASAFGTEFARSLLPVAKRVGDVSVDGFVGKPSLARSARNVQYFFVNGRMVRDSGMRWALEEAFSGSVPRGQYPVAFLCIGVGASDVDVNVHPAKTEVRFRDERSIRRALLVAVSSAVAGFAGLDESWAVNAIPGVHPRHSARNDAQAGAVASVSDTSGYRLAPEEGFFETLRDRKPPELRASDFRPVAQVLGTYIVLETANGMALLDQHAAHERVNYESVRQRLGSRNKLVQPLMVPSTLELTPAMRSVLREHLEGLTRMGFDIEEFGHDTVVVRSVVSADGIEIGLESVLDRLMSHDPIAVEQFPGEKAVAALAACVASVKAGEHLNTEAQQALVEALFSTDEPARCPHGRPTIVFISREEIERRFGRR